MTMLRYERQEHEGWTWNSGHEWIAPGETLCRWTQRGERMLARCDSCGIEHGPACDAPAWYECTGCQRIAATLD